MRALLAASLGCLLAAALATADLTPAGLAALHPSRNLVSNCSFEAGDGPVPRSWTVTPHPEFAHVVAGQAAHGSRAMVADVPALPAGLSTGLAQRVPATADCAYRLRGWVNLVEDRGGQVELGLTALDSQQRPLGETKAALQDRRAGWQPLGASLRPPPRTAWLEVRALTLTGGGRVLGDALSLEVTTGPRRPLSGPELTGLRVREARSNWAVLVWDTLPGEFLVRHRAGAAGAWQSSDTLADPWHTLLGLLPDTGYECRVALAPPPYYDAAGQPAAAPLRMREPPSITLRTAPWRPRLWNGLRLWPSAPLGALGGEAGFPCIENGPDCLYVAECAGRGVHLSRVNAANLRPEQTRQILPPQPQAGAFQGLLDTCLASGRLYFTYHVQGLVGVETPLSAARQMLAVYDVGQERLVGEPRPLPPERPGAGTWGGALTVFGQRVWVAWLEVWDEGGGRRSRLLLARYDDEAGLVETKAWEPDPPRPYLWGPSLSVFGDGMLLVCSDPNPPQGPTGAEVLIAARTDGVNSRGVQTLSLMGRNRYARGLQLGDSFYCLHRSDAAHPTYNGVYQDLMFTILGPGGLALISTPYVADMTFNTWPDITARGDALFTVYQKYSHAFGDADRPARAHGTFIGRLDTGPETK